MKHSPASPPSLYAPAEQINSSTTRGEPRSQSLRSLVNSKNHGPGRELDALVMARVFGREIKWHRGEPSYVTPDNGDGWVSESTVPRFSTTLYDAWRVIEKMTHGEPVFFELRTTGVVSTDGKRATAWAARFVLFKADFVNGTTAPHAICLAALRAVDA